MKDDNIIRVGDQVKVIIPKIFLRCGYDNDFFSALEKVKIYREEAYALALVIYPNSMYETSALTDKILEALAYGQLRKDMKHLSKRKIFCEESPDLENKVFEVSKIFFVKTGIYNFGLNMPIGWAHDDYQPPYLSNQKTHKILVICDYNYSGLKHRIEAKNVEKI